jgi:hypothetical protein
MQNARTLNLITGGAMSGKKLAALFIAAMIFGTTIVQPARAAELEPANGEPVVISEIQTGSIESANQEFIELYNQTDLPVDVTGWRLEYKSATGTVWTSKATLAGQIEPNTFYLAATAGYLENPDGTLSSGLAAGGGHIRLVRPVDTGGTADLVGWGTADSAEGGQAAPVAVAGRSIQRCFIEDGVLNDTGTNSTDFYEYEAITPGNGVICEPEDTPVEPGSPCAELLVSEVLPNPSGIDQGREFIELYNPTAEYIALADCGLQVAGSDTPYRFNNGTTLAPAGFQAFYETGLTLPNTAGGTIYLVTADGNEIHSLTYPPDMPDDAAWAWVGGGVWQVSYSPSPHAANTFQHARPCPEGQERSESTGHCRTSTENTDTLTSCPDGQERNPDTNRCRAVAMAANSPVPCRAGQERNPETGRCRAVAGVSTAHAPCKPDQERNLETNRCRNLVAAVSAPKPCAVGQERNPETNRCRKVAGAAAQAAVGVRDVAATSAGSAVGWWLAGIAGAGALGYAAFEWRQEILQASRRLKIAASRKKKP